MSLGADVKLELSSVEKAECCKLSELSGIIHAAGSLVRSGGGTSIEVVTKYNILKSVNDSLKSLYGAGSKSAAVITPLGQNYILTIDPSISHLVLTDCGIIGYDNSGLTLKRGIDKYLVMDDCCKAAFVRGVFLGAGSVSDIGGYHLEFVASNNELASDLRTLIEGLDIKCGLIERRARYIVYVKGSANIIDLLMLMGARAAAESLSNVVESRLLQQDAARGSNCYQANLDKSLKAAVVQLRAIERLKSLNRLSELSDKLRETALARLKNPEASYDELAAVLGISKSALSSRLGKITELANEQK